MAKLQSRTLFVTTSPRSPERMIPEIALLGEHFVGQKWDTTSQIAFMDKFCDEGFALGGASKDRAFSARDRINRAPKSLGFVCLKPHISLTPAGRALIEEEYTEEIFLRQLLKFQLPSPYHPQGDAGASYWVKPYLELLRLIRDLGTLRFDELQIFGLQLVDYRLYDTIIGKIEQFRLDKLAWEGRYKDFRQQRMQEEIQELYQEEIASGRTATRQSSDDSLEKFVKTKLSNARDYADACVRYLRATGLVSISHRGYSLHIDPYKREEVDYILEHIDRAPCFVDDLAGYECYLGDANLPRLMNDDKEVLRTKIERLSPSIVVLDTHTLQELKRKLRQLIAEQKAEGLRREVEELKDYRLYDEVQNTFDEIIRGDMYDAPLMLEWNVWRAMTMLDGGDIRANLKSDDQGRPMSTAQGNMPDIVCDYETFALNVEVTLASGQKQYEMEGEPVARHLAKLKQEQGKPSYCLFIAPKINEAAVAHFYTLHRTNISYYGGQSVILPLPLEVFRKMIEDSFRACYTPNPLHVQRLFEYSQTKALEAEDEQAWYSDVCTKAKSWLSLPG